MAADDPTLDINTKPLIQSVEAADRAIDGLADSIVEASKTSKANKILLNADGIVHGAETAEKALDKLNAYIKRSGASMRAATLKEAGTTREAYKAMTEGITSSLSKIKNELKSSGFSSLDELRQKIANLGSESGEGLSALVNLQRKLSKELTTIYSLRRSQLGSINRAMADEELQVFRNLGASLVKIDAARLKQVEKRAKAGLSAARRAAEDQEKFSLAYDVGRRAEEIRQTTKDLSDLQAHLGAMEDKTSDLFSKARSRYKSSLAQGAINTSNVRKGFKAEAEAALAESKKIEADLKAARESYVNWWHGATKSIDQDLEARAGAAKTLMDNHLDRIKNLNTLVRKAHQEEAARLKAEVEAAATPKIKATVYDRRMVEDATKTAVQGGAEVFDIATRKQILPNKSDIDGLGKSFRGLGDDMAFAHSAARGLASGFNLLWLTWGQMAPLLAGAAISYGTRAVIEMGAQVDHTLQIIKVLSGESEAAVSGLNTQLLELSRSGPVGPLEVAEAMKTLSLAGLNAAEVSSSIKDVMNFAVAGTASIEKAADVMSSVASAMGISAMNYSAVGDIIAKTAAVSKSSVESIGEAFKYASVLGKQYGVTLVDIATGLAALSNLGIQGTAAGTALRNMYVDLTGRTKQQSALTKKYIGEVRDDAGNMKDIVTIMLQSVQRMSNLKPIAQKDLLQKMLTERSSKPFIEMLDRIKTKAGELEGITFDGLGNAFNKLGEKIGTEGAFIENKLLELKTQIEDFGGFSSVSAAKLSLTPLNQMKSVISGLQASLVEAFNGMEPQIIRLSNRLKELFASPQFLNTVQNMAMGIAGSVEVILKNLDLIGIAVSAILGAKVVGIVMSAGASFAAFFSTLGTGFAAMKVAFASMGTSLAAFGAGVLAIGRFLGPIGAAITGVVSGLMLYNKFSQNRQDKLVEAANSGAIAAYEKSLTSERDRLKEINEALLNNISLEELRKRRATAKASEDLKSELGAKEALADRKVYDAKAKLDRLESEAAKARAAGFTGRSMTFSKQAEAAKKEYEQAIQSRVDTMRSVADARRGLVAIEQDMGKISKKNLALELENNKKLIASGVVGLPETDRPGAGQDGRSPMRLKYMALEIRTNLEEITSTTNKNLEQIQGDWKASADQMDTLFKNDLMTLDKYTNDKEALTKKFELSSRAILDAGQTQYRNEADSVAKQAYDEYNHYVTKQIPLMKVSEEEKAELIKTARERLQAYIDELGQKRAASEAAYEARLSDIATKGAKERFEAQINIGNRALEAAKEIDKKNLEVSKKTLDRIKTLSGEIDDIVKSSAKNLRSFLDEFALADAKDARDRQALEPFKFVDENSMIGLQAAKSGMEAVLAVIEKVDAKTKELENSLAYATVRVVELNTLAVQNDDPFGGPAVDAAVKAYTQVLELKKQIKALETATPDLTDAAKAKAEQKVLEDHLASLQKGTTDAIMTGLIEGGEAGRSALRAIIVKELSRPIRLVVQAIVNPIVGAISGALGLAAPAVAGTAGSAVGSAATGILGSAVGAAGAFGTAAGYGASALFGGTGLTALSGGASMLMAGNVAQGLGMITGVLGPIALGIGALLAISKATKGEKRSGAEYELQAGNVTLVSGPSGGPINQRIEQQLATGTVKSINTMLADIGSAATVSVFGAGLETSEKGRGGVYAGGVLSTGQGFGNLRDTRVNESLGAEDAATKYGLALKKSVIASLQVATDIPKAVKALVELADVSKMTESEIDELISTLETQRTSIKSFQVAIKSLPFEQLKGMSYDTANAFIEAAGGIDVLLPRLQSLADSYLTEGQKIDLAYSNAQAALSGAGLDVSVADLKKLTRADIGSMLLGASPEALGNTLFSGLLTAAEILVPALDLVEASVEEVADAAEDLDEAYQKVLDDQKSLTEKLNELTEDRVAALTAERSTLAPGNQLLFDRVTMLELEADYLSAVATLQSELNSAIDGLMDGLSGIEAIAARANESLNQSKDSLKDAAIAILDGQYEAQKELLELQKEAYTQLKDFSSSISDYIAELDGQNTELAPADRIAAARKSFDDLAAKAAAGDESAQGKLIEAAQKFLEVSKDLSGSVVDYRRDTADVKIALLGVQSQAETAFAEMVRPENQPGFVGPVQELDAAGVKSILSTFEANNLQESTLAGRLKVAAAKVLDFNNEVARITPYLTAHNIEVERSKDGLEALTSEYDTAKGVYAEALDALGPIIEEFPEIVESEAVKIAKEFDDAVTDFAKDIGIFVDNLDDLPADMKDVFTGPGGVVSSMGEIINGEGGLVGKIKTIGSDLEKGSTTVGGAVKSLSELLPNYKSELQTSLAGAVTEYKTASGNLTGYSEKFGLSVSGMTTKLGTELSKYDQDVATNLASMTTAVTTAGNAATAALNLIDKLNSITVSVNVTVSGGGSGSGTGAIGGGVGGSTGGAGTGSAVVTAPENPVISQPPVDVGPPAPPVYSTTTLALGAKEAIDAWKEGRITYGEASKGIIVAAQSLGIDSEQTAAAVREAYSMVYPGAGIDLTGQAVSDYAVALGLPAFEVGTNYVPQDMIAMLHEGEAVVPKEYNSPYTPTGDDTERLEALVSQLIQEVAEMKEENRAVAGKSLKYQRVTAEALDKFDSDGLPPTRT